MQKNNFVSVSVFSLILKTCLLVFPLVITGCSGVSNSVIAATGTTIGVEISQNQTTQTPIAILGYKRAELAYVPTNKSIGTKKTETIDSNGKKTTVVEEDIPLQLNSKGAGDSANVLMELKYFGIFSQGADSGIYQRLAVGDIAVAQKGAALLFSRDSAGKVDAKLASYITQAKQEITVEEIQLNKIISYVTDGSGAVNKKTLTALVTEAKKIAETQKFFPDNVVTEITEQATGIELHELLFALFDKTIDPMYKSLPNN